MTHVRTVKARTARPRIVAVLSSPDALQRGIRLRQLPDYFELRLDALVDFLPMLDVAIGKLRAPFIVTARHPLEGGLHQLSLTRRRQLLLRYLPIADFVDVELRSAKELRSVLDFATASNVKRILSVHEFKNPPAMKTLAALTHAANALSADIFKIVVRTETAAELTVLTTFLDSAKTGMPISAMGVGKLGRSSRRLLARRGSFLNYAHLGTSTAPGQFSLSELRRTLKAQ